MTKSILTEEQKAYLLRIAPNRFNKEITLLINNKFKTNCTLKHRFAKEFSKKVIKELKNEKHKYD